MVQAFSYLHDAIYKDSAMPGPGVNDDFFAGQSAFTVTQISRASLLPKNGFKWNALPLPAGPSGNYAVVGQAGIGVFAKSAHVSQAEDFLAYFTDPANSKKLAQYFPPPRKSELNAATLGAANPLLSPEQLQNTVVNSVSGTVRPSHTNSAQIEQKAKQALDAMWQPNANVSAVLKNVCTAIDPMLASP
jgi:multiple sugar transport system substrate-binding protein